MPKNIIRSKLSMLQLEAVDYACQAHETFLANKARRGFLLGDGAGVGKVQFFFYFHFTHSKMKLFFNF